MFPLYQTSGFYAAPVSKALVGGSVIASVGLTFPLAHLRTWFRFSYSSLFLDHHFLRYLACRCVFLDPKDILCAGVIFYHFRIFERRYGSRKFASFLLCNLCVSLLLELCCIYALQDFDLEPFPSGPYGVIYSLYVPFLCDIPRVAYTHVMGVPVTGKSLTFIVGLQLLSGSLESMLLALIGLVSGVLVRCNIMWIQSWMRIPKFVGSVADKTLGRLLNTPKAAPTTNTPMGATIEIQRQQQLERIEHQMAWAQLQPQQQQQGGFAFNFFGNQGNNIPVNRNGPNDGVPHANPAPAPLPSDDQVQRLVEMGFNRDNVLNALRSTNNDINQATNILLHEM